MQLPCEEIAEAASHQKVDLERLFTEMIESVALRLHSVGIEGGLRASGTELTALTQKIRSLGFTGLSNGQWKKVLDMEEIEAPSILENLESLIRAFGRYCTINDAMDLRISIQAWRTIGSDLPVDAFLNCLAETAVNQQLDAQKIGVAEMRLVHSQIDVDLLNENRKIVLMTRGKIDALLRS